MNGAERLQPGRVAAVLLAAGQSRRFGPADKLLAPLDGQPLALHIAGRLGGMGFSALIAVCSEREVADLLAGTGFVVVSNTAPASGLSRSLALGMAVAAGQDVDAALLCLADMPYVPVAHLEALMAGFDPANANMVASALGGQPMPPALFGRAHFERLQRQEGDRGARALLRDAALVPASVAMLADMDVPGDLGRR